MASEIWRGREGGREAGRDGDLEGERGGGGQQGGVRQDAAVPTLFPQDRRTIAVTL